MKTIIIIFTILSISILSFSKDIKNTQSSIRFEINESNIVIIPSNIKHKYSLIIYIGKRNKKEEVKLILHNDHLMASIPDNVEHIELKNESTREFFTLK